MNWGLNVHEGNQVTFCWPWEAKVTFSYLVQECVLLITLRTSTLRTSAQQCLESPPLKYTLWEHSTKSDPDIPSFSQNLKNLKTNHDALLAKGDELNVQLKEERLKSFHLQKELQSVTISNRRTEEVRLCSRDLESAWATYR